MAINVSMTGLSTLLISQVKRQRTIVLYHQYSGLVFPPLSNWNTEITQLGAHSVFPYVKGQTKLYKKWWKCVVYTVHKVRDSGATSFVSFRLGTELLKLKAVNVCKLQCNLISQVLIQGLGITMGLRDTQVSNLSNQ